MTIVTTVEQLEEIYGTPGAASLRKVSDHITPEYRAWIKASPMCLAQTTRRTHWMKKQSSIQNHLPA